jgi:hypothetical protein
VLNYRKNAIIFPQGSPADLFSWVRHGVVETAYCSGNGSRIVTSLVGPGEIFGAWREQKKRNGLGVTRFSTLREQAGRNLGDQPVQVGDLQREEILADQLHRSAQSIILGHEYVGAGGGSTEYVLQVA